MYVYALGAEKQGVRIDSDSSLANVNTIKSCYIKHGNTIAYIGSLKLHTFFQLDWHQLTTISRMPSVNVKGAFTAISRQVVNSESPRKAAITF